MLPPLLHQLGHLRGAMAAPDERGFEDGGAAGQPLFGVVLELVDDLLRPVPPVRDDRADLGIDIIAQRVLKHHEIAAVAADVQQLLGAPEEYGVGVDKERIVVILQVVMRQDLEDLGVEIVARLARIDDDLPPALRRARAVGEADVIHPLDRIDHRVEPIDIAKEGGVDADAGRRAGGRGGHGGGVGGEGLELGEDPRRAAEGEEGGEVAA